jgi:hypothetical protein
MVTWKSNDGELCISKSGFCCRFNSYDMTRKGLMTSKVPQHFNEGAAVGSTRYIQQYGGISW